MAEVSFHQEYQTYHSNLPYIHFFPSKNPVDASGCPIVDDTAKVVRFYNTGFGEGTDFVVNSLPLACPGMFQYMENDGNVSGESLDILLAAAGEDYLDYTTTASSFLAASIRRLEATRFDLWSIDHQKNLVNRRSDF